VTETGAPARRPLPRRRGGSATLRLTLLLMIVLLALGVVGLASLSLFRLPPHQPPLTQDAVVQRICTAYQTRNYDLLVAQIDPSPIPPAITGPFSDAAKRALIGELQALDASDGTVTQCQVHRLTFNNLPPDPTRTQYTFTITRADDLSKQFILMMTLVHQPDGSWKIARDSNFLGTAG
jgi:hypothetical protein